MALRRGTGIVLRIRDFAEADLIVTLFTEPWGKRGAIAKGARRFGSKLGGVFDLLNRVEVVFYERSRLDLVSQGALLHGYARMKRDLIAVNYALNSARLLERLLPLHQPEERIYSLFTLYLDLLEQGDVPMLPLHLAATLKLFALLGHRPNFRACSRCGSTTGPFLFAPLQGGILCHDCFAGDGIPITRGLSLSLHALLSLPLPRAGRIHLSPEDGNHAQQLLALYLDYLAGRG